MAIQTQVCTENIGGFLPLSNFQDWNLDNGVFCSGLIQKPLQKQQLLQQMYDQSLFFHDNLLASSLKSYNSVTGNGGLDLMCYFQSQWQEIDRFIASQNERLRLMMQEQRKQQIAGLMKRIESKTSALLRQKDEEILKAANKTVELENLLKRLEMENQAWQRAAQEKEAMVVSLKNTLEEMREKASCCVNNGAEDAESCCQGERGEDMEATGESRGIVERNTTTMVCRGCETRNSCVLFLPCRHLCACKGCDAFLDSCPVCKMPKKASIEALLF